MDSGEVYLVKQRSLQQGGHSVSHTSQPGRENTASGLLVWGTRPYSPNAAQLYVPFLHLCISVGADYS
jgi:hypothetical protein